MLIHKLLHSQFFKFKVLVFILHYEQTHQVKLMKYLLFGSFVIITFGKSSSFPCLLANVSFFKLNTGPLLSQRRIMAVHL